MTWSRTSRLIARAAQALDVECTSVGRRHSDWLLRLRAGDRSVIVSKTRSPFLTQVAQTLANSKRTSRELLAAIGVPVVPALVVDATTDPRGAAVRESLQEHGRVTVKPNWGNRARGCVPDLHALEPCARALELARALDLAHEALVEPYVRGINVRVAVIGGRCAAACEITRPRIVGDGERTFAALVAAVDADPRRYDPHREDAALVGLDRIVFDEAALAVLALDGVAPEIVLPRGRVVELVGDEAETIDRTDDLHPSWAEMACRACAHLGVDVGGVDLRGPAERFLAPAPPRWWPGEACLLEVNVLPALHVHALPTEGRARPVFEAFVAYCLSLPGAPAPCAVVQAGRG